MNSVKGFFVALCIYVMSRYRKTLHLGLLLLIECERNWVVKIFLIIWEFNDWNVYAELMWNGKKAFDFSVSCRQLDRVSIGLTGGFLFLTESKKTEKFLISSFLWRIKSQFKDKNSTFEDQKQLEPIWNKEKKTFQLISHWIKWRLFTN